MPRKVVLTGRIPTVEETARELGVSPKRTREIVALMDAIIEGRLRTAGRARHKRRAKGAGEAAGLVPRTSTRTARH